ncbi:uncharacterized protein LOC119796545 [Cyprinodon tularosa]|uniref:uncharacterized protein LOC119796545 n=1 Tax=Cyprinodon tularosa TaxID=77115 RepID=UPI0018E28EBD|nr:uncharacterized protein LOC119796545 [Cyprinodon tularosa]
MSRNNSTQSNHISKDTDNCISCQSCQFKFFPSTTFDIKANGICNFEMSVFKNKGDKTPFWSTSFTRTEENDMKEKSTMKCPNCKKTFWLFINLCVNTDTTQLKIKLSIKTGESENQQDKQEGTSSVKRQCRRVKVFCMRTGETFGGDDEVKERLLKNRSPSALFQETDLNECSVIMVFCPIISRIGSDVDSCMRDPRVSSSGKPVILVLMHHTRDTHYSTAGTIWTEEFDNVVLDVHLLFHETKPGLLKCSENETAFKRIQQKLDQI